MRIVLAGQKRFGRDVLDLVSARGWEVAAVFCPEGDDKLRIGAMNRRLPVFGARELTAAMIPAGCRADRGGALPQLPLRGKTQAQGRTGRAGVSPVAYCRGTAGASAIEWALRFGEAVTGGSVFWLNDVVDGGAIAAQDFLRDPSGGHGAASFGVRELAPMGLRLFARVFR